MTRIVWLTCLLPCLAVSSEIRLERVPHGGIQPQAVVDRQGTLHLVYFAGDPARGDLFYVTRSASAKTFSSPIRVNSQPGSAIAVGTIRGAQIALGRGGRIHVAWNGSSIAEPRGPGNPAKVTGTAQEANPMLYTRGSASGFEPQRNLMRSTFTLDGGGTVTADANGRVIVAWQARTKDVAKGEGGRAVWAAVSKDDGESFGPEVQISPKPGSGACACCSMRLFATSTGSVYGLYRGAKQVVHRDIHLLSASTASGPFRDTMIDPWKIGACPMSSMSFAESKGQVVAAWETAKQIYWSPVPVSGKPSPAPGTGVNRKHPTLARAGDGSMLLVWSEGTAWRKGGSIAWQLFDPSGRPSGALGAAPDLRAWSLPATIALANGDFLILY